MSKINDRLEDGFWNLNLKVKVVGNNLKEKKYFSRAVWWFMFRSYKDYCKENCLKCDMFEKCQEKVRENYQRKHGKDEPLAG